MFVELQKKLRMLRISVWKKTCRQEKDGVKNELPEQSIFFGRVKINQLHHRRSIRQTGYDYIHCLSGNRMNNQINWLYRKEVKN